jgi:hypothetical protein
VNLIKFLNIIFKLFIIIINLRLGQLILKPLELSLCLTLIQNLDLKLKSYESRHDIIQLT